MNKPTIHIIQWLKVLWAERILFDQKAMLSIIQGAIWLARGKKVDPTIVYERYRTCLKCPIYDPALRRCRAVHSSVEDGSEIKLGCGCYIPFYALTDTSCWGYKRTNGIIGWGEANKNNKI